MLGSWKKMRGQICGSIWHQDRWEFIQNNDGDCILVYDCGLVERSRQAADCFITLIPVYITMWHQSHKNKILTLGAVRTWLKINVWFDTTYVTYCVFVAWYAGKEHSYWLIMSVHLFQLENCGIDFCKILWILCYGRRPQNCNFFILCNW